MKIMGVDLGVAGRTALVCGSSKGLGRACAEALAEAGVNLVLCARSQGPLDEAAAEIGARSGVQVRAVAADVATREGRQAILEVCPDPDILINNAGGPPPGRFEDWDEADWGRALDANMIAPIQLIRATVGAMRARKWGRIINITSGAVKAPLPLLGLSNGARAGLTGFIAGLAREVAGDGVTVNNLLPGHFETDRLRGYASALAKQREIPLEQAWREIAERNPTGRVGQPAEFGAMCAFLASVHCGYVTGQNILMDGGAYPGVF
jgi:3-oxoacyl-[acyl-carrier protein] reductase